MHNAHNAFILVVDQMLNKNKWCIIRIMHETERAYELSNLPRNSTTSTANRIIAKTAKAWAHRDNTHRVREPPGKMTCP